MSSALNFSWTDVNGTVPNTYLCEVAITPPYPDPSSPPIPVPSRMPTFLPKAPTNAPAFTSSSPPTHSPTGVQTYYPTPAPSMKSTVSPTARPSAFTLHTTEIGQLVPGDLGAAGSFGRAVSLYGDSLVVGAIGK